MGGGLEAEGMWWEDDNGYGGKGCAFDCACEEGGEGRGSDGDGFGECFRGCRANTLGAFIP